MSDNEQENNKMKGNKFWTLRAKHGRDKIFKTPTIMLEAACEYFQWCEDNPLYETNLQKIKTSRDTEEIKLVDLPKMRALTMHGLCSFLHVNTMYFNQFEKSIKEKAAEKLTDEDKDFSLVITHIREIIYNQKFTGAAAGFLNANIIARDLGLKDKSETEHAGDINLTGEIKISYK